MEWFSLTCDEWSEIKCLRTYWMFGVKRNALRSNLMDVIRLCTLRSHVINEIKWIDLRDEWSET